MERLVACPYMREPNGLTTSFAVKHVIMNLRQVAHKGRYHSSLEVGADSTQVMVKLTLLPLMLSDLLKCSCNDCDFAKHRGIRHNTTASARKLEPSSFEKLGQLLLAARATNFAIRLLIQAVIQSSSFGLKADNDRVQMKKGPSQQNIPCFLSVEELLMHHLYRGEVHENTKSLPFVSIELLQ